LIREIFRIFGGRGESSEEDDGTPPSPVVVELSKRKIANCGVVAARFDFGPLLAESVSGLDETSAALATSVEGDPSESSEAAGALEEVPLDEEGEDEEKENEEDEDSQGVGKGPRYITDALYLFGSTAEKSKKDRA